MKTAIAILLRQYQSTGIDYSSPRSPKEIDEEISRLEKEKKQAKEHWKEIEARKEDMRKAISKLDPKFNFKEFDEKTDQEKNELIGKLYESKPASPMP